MSNQTNATREWVLENIESGSNGSQYDETIVNISSEQILNMGDTPVELLPAPDANQYYDIESIIIEGSFNTTAYSNVIYVILNGTRRIHAEPYNDGSYVLTFNFNHFPEPTTVYSFINDLEEVQNVTINLVRPLIIDENRSVYLTAFGYNAEQTNPTGGDGTLRAIIKYKVRTFGE